ncbi:MAG: MBL fold metallo-hydrolase [Sneathiellales bacterium]|nr:MBL fold metallo-hydrolase [Sneathiellales bacterium]
MKPLVKAFFHEPTFTVSYVVSDGKSGKCAIIDSVLDYDPKSGRTSTEAADELIAYLKDQDLSPEWILETHVHADHLSGAPYLKDQLGGEIGIGANVTTVQSVFKDVFNAEKTMPVDGSQFDRLLEDEEIVQCGALEIQVLFTPGHTPACVSYAIGDAVFVGDTMFMPDFGTARCDFPGGDATQLYKSIRKILSMPGETRLFMCHDYAPNGREYKWETTVAAQKDGNIHVNEAVSADQFVEMRDRRDAELDMPVLILPSVQVNMRAGNFPEPEDNGVSYLKIPLNSL